MFEGRMFWKNPEEPYSTEDGESGWGESTSNHTPPMDARKKIIIFLVTIFVAVVVLCFFSSWVREHLVPILLYSISIMLIGTGITHQEYTTQNTKKDY